MLAYLSIKKISYTNNVSKGQRLLPMLDIIACEKETRLKFFSKQTYLRSQTHGVRNSVPIVFSILVTLVQKIQGLFLGINKSLFRAHLYRFFSFAQLFVGFEPDFFQLQLNHCIIFFLEHARCTVSSVHLQLVFIL